MGDNAYRFVDFLQRAGQTWWQILPIGPTSYGDSPYQSFSSVAGNPYFIDLPQLERDGLLERDEYERLPWCESELSVDYGQLYQLRYEVLHHAYRRFAQNQPEDYAQFCRENERWLPDYALFMALKDAHGGRPWNEWEQPLKTREPGAIAAAREQYAAILSDIPDYCCVLFVYDTVEFKINSTMKKLAAAVKEHAQIVSFGKQSERSLCAWITRHFRAHGKSVTDELCQYLIFRTDGLMTTLGGEIDKIAAYQEGEVITRGAIDAVVIPALSAQTFDISDAVVNRNFEKALFKLQELYAMQTDPIAVLGAIGAQLRRLYYARVILSSGGGQKELMELTGLKSYPAGLTMTAARRVTDRFCQSAIQLVLDTDLAMKTSAGEQEQLLELLLVRLAQEAQHG